MVDSIERSGRDWSYQIDTSSLPDYVLIRLEGTLDAAARVHHRQDVSEVVGRLQMAGTNAPIIFDWRDVDMSTWSVPRYLATYGGLFHGTQKLIGIPSRDWRSAWAIEAMVKLSEALQTNFVRVDGMSEAIAQVEQWQV